MKKLSQKGVSALFAILILSVMMAIVLGLSTIVVTQVRTVKGIGDSLIAFYAADAGIEYMIKIIVSGDTPAAHEGPVQLGNNASYTIDTFCCNPAYSSCVATCPPGLSVKNDCAAPRYCVKSTGIYSAIPTSTRAAIEVEI
jgi:hypothetical protein